MPPSPKVNPRTGKRFDWEEKQRALKGQDADLERIQSEIALLERQQVAVESRRKFMTFIKFTSPDPEFPNDVRASKYKNARHHDAIARVIEEVVFGGISFLILTMPPRHGKALALDTPVPTPDGWKTMGQLSVGDYVFDERGHPTKVIAKSPVWKRRDVYQVTSDDGHSVIADAEHEWSVRLCRKRPVFKNKTTRYLAERASGRNPRLPAQGALQLPWRDLPIDPYVLGVWLGDGCSGHATITADDEDGEFIRGEIERRGYATSDRVTIKTFGVLGLLTPLKAAGLLRNKHVPEAYLRASEDQRRDLLKGLIDTDGFVAPDGQVEFCNTNMALATAVRELAHSLGYKASLVTGRSMLYGVDHGPKWRVMFYADDVALLPRKAARCRAPKRFGRYISVESAGVADTVCIEVASPSHLFLAGTGMLPTHNSEQVSRKLPAWFMGLFPHLHGIVATYNDDFAMDFGKDVRAVVKTPQFSQVFPSVALQRGGAASDRLQTTQGGQWSFVGRGGSLTGRGGHILICDDLIKDDKEASSQAIRDQAWNWFTKVAMSRRMGRKLVILTFTRWHSDDPIGRLTDPENPHYNHKLAQKIKIINLPAIAEDDDPLGRKPGEPLWPDGPDRFDLDFLEEQQALDPLGFAALYQQRPSVLDGDLFKRESVQWYKNSDLPDDLRIYCASDHAVATGQRNDFTVLLKVGVDKQNNIYLLECFWQKAKSDLVVEAMLEMGGTGRRKPLIWWAEKGHISKSIGPFLNKRMVETQRYFTVREVTPIGDKAQRAQSIAARVAMGKVYFPKEQLWAERAINQMMAFPNGTHDDFVDTLSMIGLGLESQHGPTQKPVEPKAPEFGTLEWVKFHDKWKRQQAAAKALGGF